MGRLVGEQEAHTSPDCAGEYDRKGNVEEGVNGGLIIWLSNIMLRSPLPGSDQRGYACTTSATIVRQLNSSALLLEMETGASGAPTPLY